MDLEQKREFIRNFMDSMTQHAIRASEKMPAEWDGHELRKWLADEFAGEVSAPLRTGGIARDRKRLRAYRNAVGTIAGL